MGVERAGVLVVRDGRLALIERVRAGRRYWVIPGGGVEPGEAIAQAAQREAEEELGVVVTLGRLRVQIDYREHGGSFQRQWYFDATVATDAIKVVGPEIDGDPERGSYRAVWLDLREIGVDAVLPAAVARLVVANGGRWPDHVIEIDERQPMEAADVRRA